MNTFYSVFTLMLFIGDYHGWWVKTILFIEDIRVIYKKKENLYPDNYYNFQVIDINYINTSQVIALNLCLFNRFLQFLYEKR